MNKNLLIVPLVLLAIVVAVIALLNTDPSGAGGARTGSRYVDAVRAESRIDPDLIAWDESAPPMPVAMDAPRGVAVDARDRIVVIGDRLVILTAEGDAVLRSDPLAGDYRAVAVDHRGGIVAADRGRVDLIEPDGSSVRVVRSVDIPGEGVPGGRVPGGRVDLTAVAVSAERIFAADSGACAVYSLPLLDADGGPPFERLADGFFVPGTMDLTVSPDGELTTVDPGRHAVQVRDGYGDVLRAFGQRGNEVVDFWGCCNPTAIAVTLGGQIVTAEKGLATTRVKVYGPNGKLDSVVAGPDAFDHRPDGPPILLDLAVDSTGRVLVLDPSRRQVRVFTRRVR